MYFVEENRGDGHKHIFRTDDQIEYLRHTFTSIARDWKVLDDVTVQVTPVDRSVVRLELGFKRELEFDLWHGFTTDISAEIDKNYTAVNEGGDQIAQWYDFKPVAPRH